MAHTMARRSTLLLASLLFVSAPALASAQSQASPAPSAMPTAQSPMPASTESPSSMASPAGAQQSPNATVPGSVSPSEGGRGGVPPTIPHAKATPFSHLPIIDIVPIFTQPRDYNDSKQLVNAGGTAYDPFDIGGTVKIPIFAGFSASFDRVVEDSINQPNERVTTATGAYTYPAYSRDAVLVYRIDEQIKRFQVEAGLVFRHRIAGGVSTSNNPRPPTISSTEAHYGYAGLTYSTPGIRAFNNSFFTFNINVDEQNIDHHVATATGFIDENPAQQRVYETDQYVALTIPVDAKHGVSLFAQDRWGALNFYENAPYPYRWAMSRTFQLNKKFNPYFTLSLRDKDQRQIPQGAPFVRPNSTHVGAIDIIADFKFDLNQFTH